MRRPGPGRKPWEALRQGQSAGNCRRGAFSPRGVRQGRAGPFWHLGRARQLLPGSFLLGSYGGLLP
jgi:hypothetical protein